MRKEMLNGLDLFSGIGGLSIALSEWSRPIAYCEINSYCQAVLLSQMAKGSLHIAPIWDDITTLSGEPFHNVIDIIYGGFPCQDISVAGNGKGLEGERSRLFYEIMRLSKEIKPKFIFLENVPAITSRGGLRVVREVTEMGYDCRWCVISAASVGALHRRERWFLLGYSQHFRPHGTEERRSVEASVYTCEKGTEEASESKGAGASEVLARESFSHATICNDWKSASESVSGQESELGIGSIKTDVANSRCECEGGKEEPGRSSFYDPRCSRFWAVEPSVGRVAHGVPRRVDRIRGLGNAVVPKQAKEAFKILMGKELFYE
jgi:DNA (cytosine-5)-methyltransferase 1